jgi:hypothetical protein
MPGRCGRLTWYVTARLQKTMGPVLAMALAGFAFLIYSTVVVIFWRNVKLSQPWKAIFSLTICPMFLAAMVLNIWLTNKYAGWLLDELASATARGANESKNIAAFMASCPIAFAICLVWYGVMRALDALTKKSRES